MKSWLRFAAILIVSFGLAFAILKQIPKGPYFENLESEKPLNEGDAKAIDWRILRDLDYKTGGMSESLRRLDNSSIKIPGFMVPLDDNQNQTREFLLVPAAGQCIHVPPPPPNQMIFVQMKDNQEVTVSWGPVWVEGTLKISVTDSAYGKAGFQLSANSVQSFSLKKDPLAPSRPQH